MNTQITIPAAVVHLHTFASTEAYRSNLCAIHIERADIRWIAVATNGYTLTKAEWYVGESDTYAGDPLLLSAESFKALGKVSKKGDAILEIVADSDEVRGHVAAQPGTVVAITRVEGVFPDWRQVVPTKSGGSKPSAPYALNPKYLIAMAQHAEKYVLKKGLGVTCYEGGGDLSPVRYDAEGDVAIDLQVTYIIMPMRL